MAGVYVTIASIHPLDNLRDLLLNEADRTFDVDAQVVVVDEGDRALRRRNQTLFSDVPVSLAFYGPRERAEWFKTRFTSRLDEFQAVIPEKCHAETSFGFLVAYENDATLVVEVDDDVAAVSTQRLVAGHQRNLLGEHGVTVTSPHGWYNTLDNLRLGSPLRLYPRGHPYAPDCRARATTLSEHGGRCILNMGLWRGAPDFDALTIAYHGGLDGVCGIRAATNRREKVIVGSGTYFAVCSMNTAFLPRITPAFYQLYMNHLGIDRFDDIWSGLFLKRVADQLGDQACLGAPLVYHDKRPRDTFHDLAKELEGMMINEALWREVDHASLEGSNYTDAYCSLIEALEPRVSSIARQHRHEKFLRMQLAKMRTWTEITDTLR